MSAEDAVLRMSTGRPLDAAVVAEGSSVSAAMETAYAGVMLPEGTAEAEEEYESDEYYEDEDAPEAGARADDEEAEDGDDSSSAFEGTEQEYERLLEDKQFQERFGNLNIVEDWGFYDEYPEQSRNIFEKIEVPRKLYLPDKFDVDTPLYMPHGKYEITAGLEFEDVSEIKRISSGAMGEVEIFEGTIAGMKLKFIAKCWNVHQEWRGFWSELFLFASSDHLRQLQGICVPFLIGVHARVGGNVCVTMDPPHPGGWREATPVMEEHHRKAVVEAFDKIHAAGVLHNDVEFRHILIGADDRVTVIDFQESWSLTDNPDVRLSKCTQKDIDNEGELVRAMVDWPVGAQKRFLKKEKYIFRRNRHNRAAIRKWAEAREPKRTRETFSNPELAEKYQEEVQKLRAEAADLTENGPPDEATEKLIGWQPYSEEDIDATSDYETEDRALRFEIEKDVTLRYKLKHDDRRSWGPIDEFKELPRGDRGPQSPEYRPLTPPRVREAMAKDRERREHEEAERKAKQAAEVAAKAAPVADSTPAAPEAAPMPAAAPVGTEPKGVPDSTLETRETKKASPTGAEVTAPEESAAAPAVIDDAPGTSAAVGERAEVAALAEPVAPEKTDAEPAAEPVAKPDTVEPAPADDKPAEPTAAAPAAPSAKPARKPRRSQLPAPPAEHRYNLRQRPAAPPPPPPPPPAAPKKRATPKKRKRGSSPAPTAEKDAGEDGGDESERPAKAAKRPRKSAGGRKRMPSPDPPAEEDANAGAEGGDEEEKPVKAAKRPRKSGGGRKRR